MSGFNFIGIYDGERYEIDRDIIIKGLGRLVRNDYEAIQAAKEIAHYANIPDGSPFRHYFEEVEVYEGERRIAWTNGQLLWRD